MVSQRTSPPKSTLASVAHETVSLTSVANLGPKSASYLAAAGIKSFKELESLGSVAAFAKVKKVEPRASLNLLWAIEGALTGLHWREVAKEHRTSLLLALESHEQQVTGKSLKA
jgi:DNA transformation protein and related proteins